MKLFQKLFKNTESKEKEVKKESKQDQLIKVGREQFLKLKQKGLALPIFTL